MSLKSLTESKYLKPADIVDGQVATVLECRDDIVGRDQEEVTTLYFEEFDKPLILNRLNAKAIAEAYGTNEATLPGARLVLHVVQAFNPSAGKEGPAIRLKPAPKKKAAKATAEDETPPQDEAGDPGNWEDDEAA